MRIFGTFLIALGLVIAAPVLAQELADDVAVEEVDDGDGDGDEELPSLIDQVKAQADQKSTTVAPPLRKFPAVDWHGYFRFRADLFTDGDLTTYAAKSQTEFVGTSLMLPPLIDNYTNSSGGATFAEQLDGKSEKTIGTANMRLRVAPVIRLSDSLRVHTTIDLLDNIVLGTTPEYLSNVTGAMNHYAGFPGPGVSIDTFTATQVPPAAGYNALNDSFSVKEAYAEWDIAFDEPMRSDSLTLGRIRVGRFAYDWGLGIVSSRGDYLRDNLSLTSMDRFRALDAEWGNYLDRAMYDIDLGPLSVMAGFGWLANGPTSRTMVDTTMQAYDVEQEDDVYQAELAIYSRPERRGDLLERRQHLFSGKPVLDWGLYMTYRRQSMQAVASGALAGDVTADYGSWELVNRDGWLLTPDVWLRMDWRPDPKTRFYAALEAAAVVGNIGNATGSLPASEVEVFQWGAALETNVTMGLVSFGLDVGAASGDSAETWGAYLGRNTAWGSDNKFTTFTFNRNYIVDMLLYREVLGGISNSAYFRPHFDFDVIPTEENGFGGMISGLYALALEPDAYPGDNRNIGLELDAHIFYEQTNRFLATAGFGALFPFGALDRPADFIYDGITADDAEWAWTIQGNLYLVF